VLLLHNQPECSWKIDRMTHVAIVTTTRDTKERSWQ
jgi:hypothetical protein